MSTLSASVYLYLHATCPCPPPTLTSAEYTKILFSNCWSQHGNQQILLALSLHCSILIRIYHIFMKIATSINFGGDLYVHRQVHYGFLTISALHFGQAEVILEEHCSLRSTTGQHHSSKVSNKVLMKNKHFETSNVYHRSTAHESYNGVSKPCKNSMLSLAQSLVRCFQKC